MSKKNRISLLVEAFLIAFGLMVFSFFAHHKFPVRFISFAALLFSAFLISRHLKTTQDLENVFGERKRRTITFLFLGIGILSGAILAFIYRGNILHSLFPSEIHAFVLIAATIGATEELVFRGFLQSMTGKVNGLFSILFSSFSHTAYKCFLFMSPAVEGDIQMGYLFFWTLGIGLLFGTVRHYSKSITIPLVAHAIFDILVYAESSSAPWWVW